MKKDPQPVVLEAGEATSGTLDLLDAQVQTLGRAVGGAGAMVVQDLGAPALERVAERADLFDLVWSPTRVGGAPQTRASDADIEHAPQIVGGSTSSPISRGVGVSMKSWWSGGASDKRK